MKKSLLALALFGAFAGVAHAQSSVVVYGTVDAGISKATGSTVAVSKRDNNKLGFKGVEDLGGGLKALFHLEIRYESDTGALENNTRPLFQGQSRVGLQGGFGTLRLGRGLSALEETSTAYEPWSGMPSPAGFQSDLQIAGYTSDPLSPAGNSRNRFSNAIFYNTPVNPSFVGLQLNASVASKEANGNAAVAATPTSAAIPANAEARANPYSLSLTYTTGADNMFSAAAAYERNALETKLWMVAAAFKPIKELKLMASYQKQDQEKTVFVNSETKAWIIGANYTIGNGMLRAGYGQKNSEALGKTKQASLGYEHNLSLRTYLYADISRKNPGSAAITTAVNFYGAGLHHNF